jgi:hypothetical protein
MLAEIPILRVIWACGDANVDGGMNLWKCHISGNVMLTTTSSLVQQVKIRATTESANTTRGRWWCLVGRCETLILAEIRV